MVSTNWFIYKIGFSLGLIMLSLSAFSQRALFSGGASDGHAVSNYMQSKPSGSEIFNGSSGDGYDFNFYTQSTTLGSQLFEGGIGDGYSKAQHIQATPVGFSLYNGGDGDGADESSYEQNLVVTFGIYTGGIGDGHSYDSYMQESMLGADLYKGGNEDGHAKNSYEQQQVIGFAIYNGGIGDGYAFGSFLQNVSATSQTLFYGGMGDGYDRNDFLQATPVGTNLYSGGAGDGADIDDYEQGVVAVFGVFTGGEGDGSDIAEYQQTDFIDDVALPIELMSFTVQVVEAHVLISWETATETNNNYFIVERSNDLKHWISIDSIAGAGNSSSTLNYYSKDLNPETIINYYRLKQVDYDGASSYSMIRTADLNGMKQQTELLIYPNPVRDRINLQFTGFRSNEMILKIYDANGRLVYEKKLNLSKGQGLYEINRTTSMLEGYYIVIATDELNGTTMKSRMLVK